MWPRFFVTNFDIPHRCTSKVRKIVRWNTNEARCGDRVTNSVAHDWYTKFFGRRNSWRNPPLRVRSYIMCLIYSRGTIESNGLLEWNGMEWNRLEWGHSLSTVSHSISRVSRKGLCKCSWRTRREKERKWKMRRGKNLYDRSVNCIIRLVDVRYAQFLVAMIRTLLNTR